MIEYSLVKEKKSEGTKRKKEIVELEEKCEDTVEERGRLRREEQRERKIINNILLRVCSRQKEKETCTSIAAFYNSLSFVESVFL